jgi:8-oxo-dGTP diphosphatase
MCGDLLEKQEFQGRTREICPTCGWVYYQQLRVGAGVWLQRDGQLLLLKRSQAPFAGCWNLPAGYAETDEPPVLTAEREALEETGLRVKIGNLVDAFFFVDDPRGNGILLVYKCEVVGGAIKLDHESCEWGYFSPWEIPEALAGGGHDQAVHLWQRGYGK